MSKNHGPIRVGDLAYVARTCCNAIYAEIGGRMGFIVWVADKTTYCSDCGTRNYGPHASIKFGKAGGPTAWLKRIDPPANLDSTPEKRNVEVGA